MKYLWYVDFEFITLYEKYVYYKPNSLSFAGYFGQQYISGWPAKALSYCSLLSMTGSKLLVVILGYLLMKKTDEYEILIFTISNIRVIVKIVYNQISSSKVAMK